SSRKSWAQGAPLQSVPGVRFARAGCRAVRTARSGRGTVPFTHLAREGRMTVTIGRRELLVALGGAAAWPLVVRAQQSDHMRRIGFLSLGPPSAQASRVAALQAGLRDLGYVEGKNIVIEFRWAESEDQLRDLAADLVRMNVDVIFAPSSTT